MPSSKLAKKYACPTRIKTLQIIHNRPLTERRAASNARYQFLKFGKLLVLLANKEIQVQMNSFNLLSAPNS
jgi:hypothetical protein